MSTIDEEKKPVQVAWYLASRWAETHYTDVTNNGRSVRAVVEHVFFLLFKPQKGSRAARLFIANETAVMELSAVVDPEDGNFPYTVVAASSPGTMAQVRELLRRGDAA